MATPPRGSGGKFTLAPVGKWKKLKAMLNPGVAGKRMEEAIRRATQFNALLVQKEVRKRISDGAYTPNAQLTILIKGSSKPLIGPGDDELFKAITHQMVSPTVAFVGVLRTARDASGKPLVNVAEIVHEGMEIAVTQKMRNLFILLAKATRGEVPPSQLTGRALEIYQQIAGRGVVYPLRASTTTIVIPRRPFIRSVFEDPAIIKRCRANWEKAIAAAIKKA